MSRLLRNALTLAVLAINVAATHALAARQPADRLVALVFTTGPAWDTARPPTAQQHFATHSANLRRMRETGILVAGGRFGPYGLMLVRAPSVDSARGLLAPDSSIAVGTFRVEVTLWQTVYEGTLSR